jgi:hypothetical protein
MDDWFVSKADKYNINRRSVGVILNFVNEFKKRRGAGYSVYLFCLTKGVQVERGGLIVSIIFAGEKKVGCCLNRWKV